MGFRLKMDPIGWKWIPIGWKWIGWKWIPAGWKWIPIGWKWLPISWKWIPIGWKWIPDFRIDILAGELIEKKNSHEIGLELVVFYSNTTILHIILIWIQWWYQNWPISHIWQIL